MFCSLVLFAHPNKEKSILNKKVIQELEGIKNIEIKDLYGLYPDTNIDIKTEQESLKRADLIIFQFPLYWYSIPFLLKKWQDEVLTYNFAHGEKFELEKKHFLISFTMGGTLESYKKNNKGVLDFEDFLIPLKKMINYCKMIYEGYTLLDSNFERFTFLKRTSTKKLDQQIEIKEIISILSKKKT